MKKPLIILTGPTAVGKTALSINLAHSVNGEIISADSMQVYKTMDIGTAKIMPEEMDNVEHHMIDILDPTEAFNVYDFTTRAKSCIDIVLTNGHIPIVAGGTGFYIKALMYDTEFSSEPDLDETIRNELNDFYLKNGADKLFDLLRCVDPDSCEKIHKNNIKRVIRAIEYYRLNNEPISEHNRRENEKESPYNHAYFVLNDEREKLYDRINKRIDIMLANGLIDEVSRLKAQGLDTSYTSMMGLGYKEILMYLDNKLTLEEAIELLKKETRHFAKRQLTWFGGQKEVIWINKNEFNYDDKLILEFILTNLEKRNIIQR